MLKNIEFEEAVRIMEEQPAKTGIEETGLEESLGRILAEDIIASLPSPSFDKSPFDGYAFCSADLPGTLPIEGESFTGCRKLKPLEPEKAMRIFTGAPVPAGADVVIKQEEVTVSGGFVTVTSPVPSGTNVIKKGEDHPEGALLIKAGTKLGASSLGVLASEGRDRIAVYKKPRVLFISTGTELSFPGEERGKYGIYNSSYYFLGAVLKLMGFEVIKGGIVEDDITLIEERLRDGLSSGADIVMTTGGASVGDYDFAVRAARELSMDILFWKVRAKPGGALMAARKEDKLLISLSGNPAAAIMSLLTVLQPFLRRLTGSDTGNEELTLPLINELPKRSRVVRMLRGHEVIRDGRTWFEENPGRGNGNIASFEGCTMIGIIPAGGEPLPAGTMIRVLRLPSDLNLI